jgi:ribulose 1,5-bisphosphate carboxylase large subunit-like protein
VAVEAAVRNIPLEEAARINRQLQEALEKWGYTIPA